ncbi:MAG: CehA/McbA family metallohydrolase [bacterium]
MFFSRRFASIALFAAMHFVFAAQAIHAQIPRVSGVEFQPLSAQVKRISDSLDSLGQPLPAPVQEKLKAALAETNPSKAVLAIQDALDPLCLAYVNINPESRVKADGGPAAKTLTQHGWSVFLVKVANEAGVTAPLAVDSPNALPLVKPSTSSPSPKVTIPLSEVPNRWADIKMFNDRPMTRTLSGLEVEYRLVQIYSRDAGKREARLSFNVGQGSQDLGFRADVDILFDCKPGVKLVFDVKDEDGSSVMASFLIKDRLGRVYPAQSRRLAPDFFFHPQIYRTTGENVVLPPGEYSVSFTRGPEYLEQTRLIKVPAGVPEHRETFHLKRWLSLTKHKWFSGDHHVHAAGCAHYESPTEGVTPEDMMRQILGEDLNVGCVLSWGPCWYFQKQYFDGKLHPLSRPDYLMRYDVEVSGFPSSHAGHLCLLRLKEDDYPGTERIEQWPSWTLPVLKWGKSQGGVVGFSHSGWGLRITDEKIPSLQMPPFDGIGANEYIVDVTHDAVDFISSVDTPINWKLNIWYHTLNCGFKARISGETDFPCIYGERVGLGRLYVKLEDGKLDFDRYIEEIKNGRSYVTDGKSHLFDFKVNDVELGKNGSELKLAAPGTVKVYTKFAAMLPETRPDQFRGIDKRPLEQKPYWELERSRMVGSRQVPVEVIVNGQPVATKVVEADGKTLDLNFDVPIKESSWVALRVWPSSHTNPIWVTVDNKPVRASKASAEWCLKAVDTCWAQKEPRYRAEEKKAAADAYEHARKVYQKILQESPKN